MQVLEFVRLTAIAIIFAAPSLASAGDINAGSTREKANTSVVSYEEYYPPHARPDRLYHGVNAFQMNELDAILVMLELRPYAVLSNYGLSYLTFHGANLGDETSRLTILRSREQPRFAAAATETLIRSLMGTGQIAYAIDYLYTHGDDGHMLMGGEGYPPLPEDSDLLDRLTPTPPTYKTEPNGLVYDGNYPHFYRINVYTSEHLEIAQLFGAIVLEIQDIDRRGLSLPRYAQYKHGATALLDPTANAFNGSTNTDEYVFPGYITSKEVVSIHIQDPFSRRTYGNQISRTYVKQSINGEPVVTLKTSDGRFHMQLVTNGNAIMYKAFQHPDPNELEEPKFKDLMTLIDKYNSSLG